MRSTRIDVLRALACLLVLGRHAPMGLLPDGPLREAGRVWARFGWTGVDLFFVLSGFLVSGLLFSEYRRTGTVRIGRFLIRRGFKIYPGYYVLLLAGIVLAVANGQKFHQRAVLCDALFLQNYTDVWVGTFWPHCWSLAVEEHFYLLLCAVVFLLSLSRPGAFWVVWPLFMVMAVLCLCLRVQAANVYLLPHTAPIRYFPFRTHLRIDALLFGVALSYLHHFRPEWLHSIVRGKWPILTFSAACLAPAFLIDSYSYFMTTLGMTLVYLGYGGVLLVCLNGKDWTQGRARLLFDTLARMGVCSYSIYLWHLLIVQRPWLFTWATPVGGAVLALIVCLVECIVAGVVMGWLVEMPFLRLRDRYFPSSRGNGVRGDAPTTAAQAAAPLAA